MLPGRPMDNRQDQIEQQLPVGQHNEMIVPPADKVEGVVMNH